MKTIVSSDGGFINFVAHNAQNIGETENQPKIKRGLPTANTEFLSGRNIIYAFREIFYAARSLVTRAWHVCVIKLKDSNFFN